MRIARLLILVSLLSFQCLAMEQINPEELFGKHEALCRDIGRLDVILNLFEGKYYDAIENIDYSSIRSNPLGSPQYTTLAKVLIANLKCIIKVLDNTVHLLSCEHTREESKKYVQAMRNDTGRFQGGWPNQYFEWHENLFEFNAKKFMELRNSLIQEAERLKTVCLFPALSLDERTTLIESANCRLLETNNELEEKIRLLALVSEKHEKLNAENEELEKRKRAKTESYNKAFTIAYNDIMKLSAQQIKDDVKIIDKIRCTSKKIPLLRTFLKRFIKQKLRDMRGEQAWPGITVIVSITGFAPGILFFSDKISFLVEASSRKEFFDGYEISATGELLEITKLNFFLGKCVDQLIEAKEKDEKLQKMLAQAHEDALKTLGSEKYSADNVNLGQ